MERTESLVVQVAPTFENEKIAEMETFGWNLQGRQEIHEAGDAYGAPSVFSNTYVIKQRVSQYVKLHFVRSLTLPNLKEIRRIEEEYFNLPFPIPSSQIGPVICIAVSLLWFTCTGCVACPFFVAGVSELSEGKKVVAKPEGAKKEEKGIGEALAGAVVMFGCGGSIGAAHY